MTTIEIRGRAKQVVWFRSLGLSVYFASLITLFDAVDAWISGPFTEVAPNAFMLTALGMLTVLVAVNVRGFTDNEAESLLAALGAARASANLRSGLDTVRRRWSTNLVKLSARPGVLASSKHWAFWMTVWFAVHWLTEVFYVATQPGGASYLVTGKGLAFTLRTAAADSSVGLYVALLLCIIYSADFASRIRRNNLGPWRTLKQDANPWSARFNRAWRHSLAVMLCASIAAVFVIATPPTARGIITGLVIVSTWTVLPAWASTRAARSGRGPLAGLYGAIYRASERKHFQFHKDARLDDANVALRAELRPRA